MFLDSLFPEPLRTLALPPHGKRTTFLDERAPVAFLRHTWGDIVPGNLGEPQNAIEPDRLPARHQANLIVMSAGIVDELSLIHI